MSFTPIPELPQALNDVLVKDDIVTHKVQFLMASYDKLGDMCGAIPGDAPVAMSLSLAIEAVAIAQAIKLDREQRSDGRTTLDINNQRERLTNVLAVLEHAVSTYKEILGNGQQH